MNNIFLQYKDLLKLSSFPHLLKKITHIIFENYENVKYNDDLKQLFTTKLENRHIKILLQIHIDENFNISNTIKYLCNYGFDGVLLTIKNNDVIKKYNDLSKILELLPHPYNFKWERYLLNLNNNIDIDINNFSGIIDLSNTLVNEKKIIIYNEKNSNNILNNDLFILDLSVNCINYLEMLQINFENVYTNNIEYPTSRFIKEIVKNHDIKSRNLIIDSKRNAIYEFCFDIDFLK